jgi:hypothetical protein
MNAINKEVALRFLSDVPESNRFWCNDGAVFSNLRDLKDALSNMNSETFSHHVNSEKNDFCNWINEVVGDKDLAKEISNLKDKKSIGKKLKERISKLQTAK